MKIGCPICDTLPPGALTDLDLLMGDATRWPVTVWGIFDPPKGAPNALRLRFGARNIARTWLAEHGYGPFPDLVLNRHYRYDVPVIAASAEDLFNRGLIERQRGNSPGKSSTGMMVPEQVDAKAFLTYFNRGIALGNRGLELLTERVEKMIAEGEEVPLGLLKMIIDTGGKLATTQATLRARGLAMNEDEDAEEGFRSGSAPLPSDRIGHHRIRVIDGKARPVVDEGPADRAAFSRTSRAEGGEGLPS